MNTSEETHKTVADIEAAPTQANDKPEEPVAPATTTKVVELPKRRNSASSKDQPADDGIMRVSSKKENMRQRIGYLMGRLNSGNPVTMQAYGLAVTRAILMSSIIRNKLGDIHQVVTLCDLKDEKRESQGIKIVLSKEPIDVDSIGYQAAEPKGFWQRKRSQKPKAAKAENAQASARGGGKDKKDGSKQVEEPRDKSSARRQRSQSNRRARDKQSQTLQESKLEESKNSPKSANQARSQSARRRNRSRKPAEVEKTTEKPAPQQRQRRANDKADHKPTADDKQQKPAQESGRRRNRQQGNRGDRSVEQKENHNKSDLKSQPDEKKPRQPAQRRPRKDDEQNQQREDKRQQKSSWQYDEEESHDLYNGGSSHRESGLPLRGRRGGYAGNRRAPPSYPPMGGYDYPPMRAPYFPGQGYFMMAQQRPYYGGQQQQQREQRQSYYNQPGYQKGQGTREIGQNSMNSTSHGGQKDSMSNHGHF